MPVHVKCQRMRHILILIKRSFYPTSKLMNMLNCIWRAISQRQYTIMTVLQNWTILSIHVIYHFWIVPADDTSIEPLNT